MTTPHENLEEGFEKQKAGALPREWPAGRMGADDDGAIYVKVSTDAGKVKIEFAEPVVWFAMPPELAIGLGKSLLSKALALMVEARDKK